MSFQILNIPEAADSKRTMNDHALESKFFASTQADNHVGFCDIFLLLAYFI
jgi:hypothetical protein